MTTLPEYCKVLHLQIYFLRHCIRKLPGGLVNPGEDISEAVEREVLEETGIKSKFVSLCAFRESHKGLFGNSDLYCICILKLDGKAYDKINEASPVPQETEIAATKWMALDCFLESPYYQSGLYGQMLKSVAKIAVLYDNSKRKAVQGLQKKMLPAFKGKLQGMYFTPARKECLRNAYCTNTDNLISVDVKQSSKL